MDDSDYLSYKSLSDDNEEDMYGEEEAEWINSMRQVVTNAMSQQDDRDLPEPPKETAKENRTNEIGLDAEYFYNDSGEEAKEVEDQKQDEEITSPALPTKSLDDLIPIVRKAMIREENEEKYIEEDEIRTSETSSPMRISESSSVASGSDLLPSKSRFAPVPKSSVTPGRSVPMERTPELSGYSRPVLLESDNTISNDVYSPRVTVSLDTAFRQLQGQVSNMQQEVVETREVYQSELQRLEEQLKMTEAKLLRSKVVRGEGDVVVERSVPQQEEEQLQQQQLQQSVVSARRSPIAKSKTMSPASTQLSTQQQSSAYSPAHMRMRMEQMSAHEEDTQSQIRSLEERTRKDEANLRMYEQENAMLKDKQRSMEESVRRIQAELDLERQAKLELQDSYLRQGKELKQVKESWQEASGELLSMRPDQKRKEKELSMVTEKLRATEKRSKDLERELRTLKKELETMQYENKTSTAEILRLRDQIDRIGDDKKQLERDLKRANMVPSAGSSSDDVNRLKREFEQELKRREDRVRQLETSLTSVQKRASSYETALKKTREGASSEVRRLRQEVSDLRTALKLSKTRASTSTIKKSTSPLHGSPPPWACDEGFNEYEDPMNSVLRTQEKLAVAPASMTTMSKEESVRQSKRWATTSNLHWGSNEKQEKRKASGRKQFQPRPSSATSMSSVLDRSKNLASSSSVRRQLDLPVSSTATTTETSDTTATAMTKDTNAKISSSSSSERLAPFATDISEKELKNRVSELEQSLMSFNLEKTRIKNKLMQFGTGAGRTMAQRRAKREMESRLKFLEETTSDIRMKLRYFELA